MSAADISRSSDGYDLAPLLGQPLTAAGLDLTVLGLFYEVTPEGVCGASAQDSIGKITAVEPQQVDVGATVTLTVGEAGVVVPDVANMPRSEAVAALKDAGLAYVTVSGVEGPVDTLSGARIGDCVPRSRIINLVLAPGPERGEALNCPELTNPRLFARLSSEKIRWFAPGSKQAPEDIHLLSNMRDIDMVYVGGDLSLTFPFLFVVYSDRMQSGVTDVRVLCKNDLKIVAESSEPMESVTYPVFALIGEAVAWQVGPRKFLILQYLDSRWQVVSTETAARTAALFLAEDGLYLAYVDEAGDGYLQTLSSSGGTRLAFSLSSDDPNVTLQQLGDHLYVVDRDGILRVDAGSGDSRPMVQGLKGSVVDVSRFRALTTSGQGLFVVSDALGGSGGGTGSVLRASILVRDENGVERTIEDIKLDNAVRSLDGLQARFFVQPKDDTMESFDVVAAVNGLDRSLIACIEIIPSLDNSEASAVLAGVVERDTQIDLGALRPSTVEQPDYIAFPDGDTVVAQPISSFSNEGCWNG